MRRWATRCAWPSSTTSPSPTGLPSSCAIGSASSRTCWPTTSTCSSGSAWSSGRAPAATAAAATCSLRVEALDGLAPSRPVELGEALFVCTANSARSQLAAAVWREATGRPAGSAGTHPAAVVDPGAVKAAQRHELRLGRARPRPLDAVATLPPLVVTVCDRAHEELSPGPDWLHWSIPDPVPDGGDEAFDAVVAELRQRIATLLSGTQAA